MTDKEKYSLMIWCGALWDIAEKAREPYTKKQVADVREKIEELVNFKDADLFIYWNTPTLK